GVGVLGRADDDGVELAVLERVVELAEVAKRLRLRVLRGRLAQVHLVHVAQGDDVLAAELAEVVGTALAAGDDGDVELLIGRAGAAEGGAAEGDGPGGGGRLEEPAAGDGRRARHGGLRVGRVGRAQLRYPHRSRSATHFREPLAA